MSFSVFILPESNEILTLSITKESFSKSLGTGIRDNLNFSDIEILNDKFGKPYFRKTKKIGNLIYKKFKVKKYDLFLSISDEKDYSIAFTIIQKQ